MNLPAEKHIRLFAALPVSPEARAALGKLPRKGLEARWVHEDDLHITLRFIGDVAQGRLPEITAALARVKRPVFNVEVQGLGVFRTGRQPVLWASVQSARKLTALAGEINEKLARLGFEMPGKPYQPHITLARLKNDQNLDAYRARHHASIRLHWRVQSFHLFLSAEPDEKGSRYKVLETYPLQAKP